ncbi:MAG: hypothetical protein K0U59_10425 [Gammaproteobacteria bacterium]|nr:hypothetical protein [Gammaproteobacteria bacterium]
MDVYIYSLFAGLKKTLTTKRAHISIISALLIISSGLLSTSVAQAQFICADSAGNDGGSTAGDPNSVACGLNANASGIFSLAVGGEATASAPFSVALGRDATASSDNAVALGFLASATQTFAVAVGNESAALGIGATAIGVSARAETESSIAVGRTSLASGNFSTALGVNSTASGNNSIALGRNVTAGSTRSIAIGQNASVNVATPIDGAVALGAGSVANEANTVSIGGPTIERRIVNLAPGISANDAVNMQQFEDGLSNTVNTQQFEDGLEETLAKANAYTDDALAGGNNGSNGNGISSQAFAKQDRRISAMGAMTAASMSAAANIRHRSCETWRSCLKHGSFAAGVGHLEDKIGGAVMFSQSLPHQGSISLGVTFADGEVASSLGIGFDY